MYQKIKSQKTLVVSLGMIACVMLFAFAWIVLQQTRKNENYDAWVIHTYEVLRIASRIINNVSEIEASYRGYFLTGSESFLVPVSVQQNGVYADIERLSRLTANDPEKLRVMQEFEDLFERYKNLQEMQRRIYEDEGEKGLVIADIQQGQSLMNNLKISLEKFTAAELQNLNRRIELRKTEQFYHISTIVTGAVIAILGLLLATGIILYLLSRSAKTARRLQDIEELYRVVLESTHDGVYDFNPLLDHVVVSDTYEWQLGYHTNELSEKMSDNLRKLVHPEDYPRVILNMTHYIEKKIPRYTIDYRIRHKNGYWMWVLDRAVGTWNKAGEMVRMIGICTDISAQKKQEEALRELNAELESFTYIASHDLRSPLVNLKGFTTEIENSVKDVEQVLQQIDTSIPETEKQTLKTIVQQDIPEALSFIHTSVERMNSLTNAILSLSRIGQRVYRPILINMDDLIARCLKNLQYETNAQNVQVTAEKMPVLFADLLATEQIFSNILDNAIKYLSPERQGDILLSAMETQDETIYMIRDNGRGIQPKDQKRIFDIFQRARNSHDVRGAGMGLSFVKASVRKMGGRIWFESELERGTIFYIALPRWKGDDYAG